MLKFQSRHGESHSHNHRTIQHSNYLKSLGAAFGSCSSLQTPLSPADTPLGTVSAAIIKSDEMPILLMSIPEGVWYRATVTATPEPSDRSTMVWIKPLPNVRLSPTMVALLLSFRAPARTYVRGGRTSTQLKSIPRRLDSNATAPWGACPHL